MVNLKNGKANNKNSPIFKSHQFGSFIPNLRWEDEVGVGRRVCLVVKTVGLSRLLLSVYIENSQIMLLRAILKIFKITSILPQILLDVFFSSAKLPNPCKFFS